MKYCRKCGQKMKEQDEYCPNCGYSENRVGDNIESKFDGEFWPYLGWRLLSGLISLFTLGICYPFGLAMVARYEREHTIINGKRLTFDGKGSQFIGKWILYQLLTVITCGIFSLWIPVKKYKWIAKHTHFEGYDEELFYRTHNENELASYWDGKELSYVGWRLLANLISGLLFGILTPFGFEWICKVHYEGTVIDGYRLSFKGKGGSFVGTYFCWMLLTGITCGIFGLWVPLGVMRWEIENVVISEKMKDIYAGSDRRESISQNGEQLVEEIQDEQTILIDAHVKREGHITCSFGREAGYRFPIIDGEEMILGTDPQFASIIVGNEHRYVSRKHCGIKYDAATNIYCVMDYSSNGTYINGIRMMRNECYNAKAGDIVCLGTKECEYRLG